MVPADSSSKVHKPLVIFDGDCSFCRRWVARWKNVANDKLDFEPYQSAAAKFPEIPKENFGQALHLVDSDGTVTRGAQAVFTALSLADHKHWPLWFYEQIPGFAPVTELAYRIVSHNRGLFDSLDRFFLGKSVEPVNFVYTRRIFFTLLGLVHLIAIASFWRQIDGLIGSRGILPVADLLVAAKNQLPAMDCFRLMPSLVWLNSSDSFLSILCFVGVVLSILLMLDIAPMIVLALLYIVYLSLTAAGQQFLSFQWDALLLETTFVAIFFAPLQLWPRLKSVPKPSGIALFLLWWLVFRLNFLSGVVKLTAGDPAWHDRTAMNYHYETQPLPTWTSWFMHHAPPGFHSFEVLAVFFIELFVPFLIFAGRRMRRLAFFLLAGFQLMLMTAGNYGYFNLLAIVICIPLVDDTFWPRIKKLATPRNDGKQLRWSNYFLGPIAALLLFVTTLQLIDAFGGEGKWWSPMQSVVDETQTYRIANSYGLFRVMTKERPELIVQGSDDGVTWKDYEFKYKPGDVNRKPIFTIVYMPRLDWRMWFAALGSPRSEWWTINLLQRLLEGSPPVLDLLEKNPFPDKPPKFVRILEYDYRFTTRQERDASGAWWHRDPMGVYVGRVSLTRDETAPGQ